MLEPTHLIIPAIATLALGGALFVPLRDARHGRRATLNGRAPLFANFHSVTAECREAFPSEAKLDGTSSSAMQPVDAEIAPQPRSQIPAVNDSGGNGGPSPMAVFRDALRSMQSFLMLHRRISASQTSPFALEGSVIERSFADELATYIPSAQNTTAQMLPSAIGDLTDVDLRLSEPCSVSNDISASVPAATPSEAVPFVRFSSASHFESAPPINNASETMRVESWTRPAAVAPSALVVTTDVRIGSYAQNERVVPLTRMPLRHRTRDITWNASPQIELALVSDSERFSFLRDCERDPRPERETLLALAFREELREGRILAMRALKSLRGSRVATDVFRDAMASGSDEERSFAVDALLGAGERDELVRALGDRVDAIAAQAALAYVGTTAREDYRTALAPFAEPARIDAILTLLAGIFE